jgi:uncharacterized membrane protein
VTGLRYVALVALAVWVGGLVALGTVAAPALFAAIEAQNTPGGRELAGVLFGAVFSRFQYLAWALGLALLISLGARAALGPRPRRFAVRMWTVTAMLAGSLFATFFITPRIDAIRREVSGPIAGLLDDDPRKSEFGRLHALSTGLMLVTVLAGAGLIWVEMRDAH